MWAPFKLFDHKHSLIAYSSVSIVVLQQQQQENITHVVHKVPFGWHFGLGRFPYEFMKLSKEEGVVLVEGEHDCIAGGSICHPR